MQGTIDWYVKWLAEQRPDLSEDSRLEMATGFAMQQAPPVPKSTEIEEEEPVVEEDGGEQRKRARFLTAKQLHDILAPPKQ